ncbi:hypothetical protein KSP40_PGU013202 [Platanthera guangdongensis]|uniref:Uncharacterized protein n=1 Tax=Platanthera guangdongensis TaxID=2320717 RepID=A0ABR2N5B4_9ASPA
MKRELERKEQERKTSQKIELVSGGIQHPLGVAPSLKMNAPSPASGVPTLLNSSLPPNPAIGDALKDGRMNKKSKWDKVDGDTKIPSGGQDNPPSVSVHTAHLSAANAGTGYSAFAQLKRKEAEERKTGERKLTKGRD